MEIVWQKCIAHQEGRRRYGSGGRPGRYLLIVVVGVVVIVVVVVVVVVIAFTLNRCLYPTPSAVYPISVLFFHHREMHIMWSQTLKQGKHQNRE